MKKRILVTNDDGIHGRGLEPLIAALKRLGEVWVVVPSGIRNAASHSITLHRPLRVDEFRPRMFLTDGTPVDCVRFAVLGLLKGKIDLVVSGINEGPNLGDDVVYSGTVGGAREGAMHGIPSLAVSLVIRGGNHFRAAAQIARRVCAKVLKEGLPPKIYLNVNIPDRPLSRIQGWEVCRLGKRFYGDKIHKRTDPRGLHYYWLAGDVLAGRPVPGTDIGAVERGRVAITPMTLDWTAAAEMSRVRGWFDGRDSSLRPE